MKTIDLHVHTTASDGTCTPTEVVKLAKEKGLAAIAITDHDTMTGIGEAAMAGEEFGVEVIYGVEVSTKQQGCTIHILGYFINNDMEAILPVLKEMVSGRDERNKKIIELMNADGIDIDYNEMKKKFGISIGRPHFAKILFEKGYADSQAEAFEKFMDHGRKYYVKRPHYPIEEVVKKIKEAGGIPVLAHPFQYEMNDRSLRGLIELCMENGLQGLECFYTGYKPEQVEYLIRLADEYHLIKTGGSDFHGTAKKNIDLGVGDGNLKVSYELLKKLKEIG